MNFNKGLLVALLGLTVGLGAASGASADTRWERHHPRRDEVIDRLHRQDMRIRDERREGEMTFRQARFLHREDKVIYRHEQFDARLNGGHITKAEQRGLNQEENGVSHQIGR
jgi:hypothetical protein